LDAAELDDGEPAGSFACKRCHKMVYFTRTSSDYWNILVHHLSGGLLYGSEVVRPKWSFAAVRRRPFRERKKREVSLTRRRTVELLAAGWTRAQIAKELGLKKQTINFYAYEEYKRYGVHSAGELREILKRPS